MFFVFCFKQELFELIREADGKDLVESKGLNKRERG